MSTILAETTEQALAQPKPAGPTGGATRQLRALLWKEWCEQRLVLLALFFAQAVVFVVPRLRDGSVLCCFIAAWVVGAAVAGGEQVNGTRLFVTANPVRLSMLWLAKLLLGLAATTAFGIASVLCAVVFTDLWPSPDGVTLRDLAWLVPAGLFCFSLSHYCGCWVKSAISALGLSVALAVCLFACWLFNPVSLYISNHGQAWLHPGLIVVFVFLLSRLGRSRFTDTVGRQGQLTRRQRAWWFAQPVLLFGVLPFLGGAVVLAMDVWRFEPTDLDSFRSLSVAPDGDRIMAGGGFWQRGPWLKWRKGTTAVVASASRSSVRQLPLPRGTTSIRLGAWSPNGQCLALMLSSSMTSGTSVLDIATGAADVLLEGFPFPHLAWLSDHELAFSSHHTFPSPLDAASASPEGLRRGWGVWRAGGGGELVRPFPRELEQARARCLGFLRSPDRIVFSSALEDPSDPALFVFDIGTQRLERIKVPAKQCYCTLLPGCERVLLEPLRSEDEAPADRPPHLFDLTSGDLRSLEDLLGEAPRDGWSAQSSWVTSDGRWLLSAPRYQAKTHSLGWYAVDMRDDRAFHHSPPGPRLAHMRTSKSGLLVYPIPNSPMTRTTSDFPSVCVQLLRDTDPAARIVLAPEGYAVDAQVSCFDWLNNDELVLGVKVWPQPSGPPRRLLETPGWAGIFVADVSAKRVRPLWVGKGLTVQWRFMNWEQWQRCRHSPHRASRP